MDADLLAGLRALADPHRLRIVAPARGRARRRRDLAVELRLPLPIVRRQLNARRGRAGRGATEPPGRFGGAAGPGRGARGWRPRSSSAEAGARSAGAPGGAWPHDGEPLADTLARLALTPRRGEDPPRVPRRRPADVDPGPAASAHVVLRFLLERVFTEDRDYPEKEVNQRLALFHPDVASLRRYLVDERYVDREASGLYRRRTPARSRRGGRQRCELTCPPRVLAAHHRLDEPVVAVARR